MAVYHIKPASGPLPLPEEKEYWREAKPEHARDLDFAEIAALNEQSETIAADEEELTPVRPFRRRIVYAAIAVLALLAMLLWIVYDLSAGHGFDFGLLRRSAELAEDEALAALQSAVVVVECGGAQGSGFNISQDGLIVTNQHVVASGGLITITFSSGTQHTFVADSYTEIEGVDLALIAIDGKDLPAVTTAQTTPDPGEDVIFIGNPLGYDWTISEGVCEGIAIVNSLPVLVLSGPVRPGSSGSPVFNTESEVVGVIFATLSDQEDIGIAVPIYYLNQYLGGIAE